MTADRKEAGVLIDVTLTISPEMLTWPSDPPVTVERTKHLAQDGSNVSELRLGTHTGTHVDPPLHFVAGGAGVDDLPLDALVGPATVADLRAHHGAIEPGDLEALGLAEGTERLLLRTANSDLWSRPPPVAFPETYAHLTPASAAWCVERGLRLVGTDFLSIEARGSAGHPTHVALLEAGVVIVEGLDLRAADPGDYTLFCLPLRIAEGDGAPARVLLRPSG